ncbi:hypothetical protein [Microbacterium oleivorans]|uniref:hypothetical protein n=1 Tax=Microbacterium oleivorans TaxID=273677 RepID=UPI00203B6798|nr:hypothetical protein [Microbacterium oleivorans]MCM3695296.1 hypothetical protein [Microbacterium oleivorans]
MSTPSASRTTSGSIWGGTDWTVRMPAGTRRLIFRVLRLHPDADVWLHPRARTRLAEKTEQGVLAVTAQPADQRRRFT